MSLQVLDSGQESRKADGDPCTASKAGRRLPDSIVHSECVGLTCTNISLSPNCFPKFISANVPPTDLDKSDARVGWFTYRRVVVAAPSTPVIANPVRCGESWAIPCGPDLGGGFLIF